MPFGLASVDRSLGCRAVKIINIVAIPLSTNLSVCLPVYLAHSFSPSYFANVLPSVLLSVCLFVCQAYGHSFVLSNYLSVRASVCPVAICLLVVLSVGGTIGWSRFMSPSVLYLVGCSTKPLCCWQRPYCMLETACMSACPCVCIISGCVWDSVL